MPGMNRIRRIGVLTGGGDAPGLNAVIRAVVRTADRLGGINPRAVQQRLLHGRAEAGSLLGIGGFNLDTSLLAADRHSVARFTPLTTSSSGAPRWSRRPAAPHDEISSLLLEAGEVDL